MPSIPAMHVSTRSKVEGKATVHIPTRKDSLSSGNFTLSIKVAFDPSTDDYPSGTIKLKADLSDSTKSTYSSSSVELVNSYGKHNPTIVLTGRCKADNPGNARGLRYWIMIADNKLSGIGPDQAVISFLINDNAGNRIAYGSGAIKTGIINVVASA